MDRGLLVEERPGMVSQFVPPMLPIPSLLMFSFVFYRKVPMFGLEAIWRNGQVVGHVRRADFGHAINKTIAYGYIRDPDGGPVSVGLLGEEAVLF